MEIIKEGARGGEVPYRFGDEGFEDSVAILWLAAGELPPKREHPGAVLASAIAGEGIQEIRDWLRDLIPGPPRPRELEAWERAESKAVEAD